MIAIRYNENTGVVRNIRHASSRVLGKAGVLVLAHPAKLAVPRIDRETGDEVPWDVSNVLDIKDNPIPLNVELYQLMVTQNPLALVFDPDATPPAPVPSDLDVAIEAFRDATSPRALALIDAYDRSKAV